MIVGGYPEHLNDHTVSATYTEDTREGFLVGTLLPMSHGSNQTVSLLSRTSQEWR